MTQVLIDLKYYDGTAWVLAKGELVWRPTKRRIDGSTLQLPAPFKVPLDGKSTKTVLIDHTSAGWAWLVTEKVPGGKFERYLQVPEVGTVVNYTDLVEVDKSTLEPEAEPTAAWWSALDSKTSLIKLPWGAPLPPDIPEGTIIARYTE